MLNQFNYFKAFIESQYLDELYEVKKPKAKEAIIDFNRLTYQLDGKLIEASKKNTCKITFDDVKNTYRKNIRNELVADYLAGANNQGGFPNAFMHINYKFTLALTGFSFHGYTCLPEEKDDAEETSEKAGKLEPIITLTSKLDGYVHILMSDKEPPNFVNKKPGIYLYRNTNPGEVYALVVHDEQTREILNLTHIDACQQHIANLQWPDAAANEEYIITQFKSELESHIASHCKHPP